jgi:hypothetical protein
VKGYRRPQEELAAKRHGRHKKSGSPELVATSASEWMAWTLDLRSFHSLALGAILKLETR